MHKHPTPPQSLVDLQTWFKDAVITDTPTQSEAFISASNTQTTQERLKIYTNDYWPRLLDSLTDDFPLLKTYMGTDTFTDMLRNYILEYPPQSFTLYHLGKQLETFIFTHFPNDPFMAACAKFEWLKMKAFMAENAASFQADTLTNEEKENIPSTPLYLHPSVHLLSSPYNLPTYEAKKGCPATKKPTHIIIYRHNYKVQSQTISPTLYTLLSQFQSPTPLIQAITNSEKEVKNTKENQQIIQQGFQEAAQKGWFKSLKE